MLAKPRLDDFVMIKLGRLNYGKLVSGDVTGAVSPEGLGVTLRSRGLAASSVRLESLLDVKMFSDTIATGRRSWMSVQVKSRPATSGVPSVFI